MCLPDGSGWVCLAPDPFWGWVSKIPGPIWGWVYQELVDQGVDQGAGIPPYILGRLSILGVGMTSSDGLQTEGTHPTGMLSWFCSFLILCSAAEQTRALSFRCFLFSTSRCYIFDDQLSSPFLWLKPCLFILKFISPINKVKAPVT